MAFNEGILGNQRPNIFELLEEEAMHETLRPAVEYICKVSGGSVSVWLSVRHFGECRWLLVQDQIGLEDCGGHVMNSTSF